jgi:pimeloyl-ACP methyl ester carboxylesterase
VLREARRIRIGEVELSATIAGTGPPLLLLHGFPDAAEVWRYQVPVLAEANQLKISIRPLGPAPRSAIS